jgi:lysophospholipase L1-like esterase
VIRRISFTLLALTFAATGIVVRSAPAQAAGPIYAPPGKYYLAVGDSLGWGYQGARVSAAIATGKLNPKSFNTGYVDDFYRMLKQIAPDIGLANFSCPGQTSTDAMQATTCPLPPHSTWIAPTQFASAEAFLQAHPGQVSPITVELGPNDIVNLVTACGGLGNISCVGQKLPATLQTLGTNLATIVGTLRQLAPNAEIIVPQFYNPYAAADPSTNALAVPVNNAIAAATAPFGAINPDWFAVVNGATPQPQTVCTLTFFCTAIHDIHLTDAGYLAVTKATWDASGYQQYAHGFFAIGNSTGVGSAIVNFGSGPGCSGLVETGTQDLQPPGTSHDVYVTGNDLPGTIGNNGIQPGITYYYELVTLTASGREVDNNGGACYKVTG